MKTSELTGCALDWAVAKCEGLKPILYHDHYRRKAEIHGTEHLLPFHLEHQENIPILVDEEGVTHLLLGGLGSRRDDHREGGYQHCVPLRINMGSYNSPNPQGVSG